MNDVPKNIKDLNLKMIFYLPRSCRTMKSVVEFWNRY